MSVHQREPLENQVLGIGRGLVPVDANVLTLEEYEAVLDRIERSLAREDLKRAAQLLVVFGFRCGLRRMEALKLLVQDVLLNESPELLIRPSEWRRLKTKNATRKIPLGPLFDKRELEWLTAWTQRRKMEMRSGIEAVPYLLAIPQGNGELLIPSPEMIFNLIHPALREVTGDATVRFHHLRHSFGSWTFLRLLLSDRQGSSDLLAHLPKTNRLVAAVQALPGATLRPRFRDPKACVCTGLVARTCRTGDQSGALYSLSRYRDGRRAALLSTICSAVSQCGPRLRPFAGHCLSLRRDGGAASLPAQLYAQRSPEASRQTEASSSGHAPSDAQTDNAESGFRWIESIYHFLHRAKTPGLPLYRLIEEYGFDLATAEYFLARARYLCDLRGERGGYRHRVAIWTPDPRNPDHQERFACPERPLLNADRQIVKELAPRLIALWQRDPALVSRVVDYYVHHIWQTRNALLFKYPRRPEPARDYLHFLKDIGIPRENLLLVSFDPTPRSRWRATLGLGTRDHMEVRRAPNKANSGAVRWLGIEPVWNAADENFRTH